MIIKTPVIGIPNYPWKKKVVKYFRNNENVRKIDIHDFCYECERYIDLLKLFDDGDSDYKKSEYFINRKEAGGKSNRDIIRKISNYKKMYEEIKSGYYSCLNTRYPMVTTDGCRLDGTHRLAILTYLGIYNVNINIVIYKKVFSIKKTKEIIKNNLNYRKENYNL